VIWHDGWPVILPKGKEIPYVPAAPEEAEVSIGSEDPALPAICGGATNSTQPC